MLLGQLCQSLPLHYADDDLHSRPGLITKEQVRSQRGGGGTACWSRPPVGGNGVSAERHNRVDVPKLCVMFLYVLSGMM